MTERALTFIDLLKVGHTAISWCGGRCKNKQRSPANVNDMLQSTVHHK
jgi:hypothetical protein